MTMLKRWLTFNAVGVMGMVVQLLILAVLTRGFGWRYMVATGVAIEVTVLHNFWWHWRVTWRDRWGADVWWRQMLRFQAANGVVSMVGNLVLMRVLVSGGHVPVVVANGMAIACCSVLNYWLGNLWAFRGEREVVKGKRWVRTRAGSIGLIMALAVTAVGHGKAQTPNRPADIEGHEGGLGTDCAYANVFVGPAVATRDKPGTTFTGGVTIGQYFARTLGKGLTGSPQFELGLVGPVAGGLPVDGLVSVNYMFANKLPSRHQYVSFTGGYSRLFVTGNAVNFGFGFDFGRDEYKRVVRVEIRDYFVFTGAPQQVIGLRIAIGKFISD